jgi:hypothetical protein
LEAKDSLRRRAAVLSLDQRVNERQQDIIAEVKDSLRRRAAVLSLDQRVNERQQDIIAEVKDSLRRRAAILSLDQQVNERQQGIITGLLRRLSYTLERSESKVNTKFGIASEVFSVEQTDKMSPEDLAFMLDDVLESVSDEQSIGPNDLVRLIYRGSADDGSTISVSTGSNNWASASDALMDKVNSAVQSAQTAKINGRIEVQAISMPSGGGYKAIRKLEDFAKKKCVIQIKNKDKLCMARAIIVSLAAQHKVDILAKICGENLSSLRLKYITTGRQLQTEYAVELHRKCGLAEVECGLDHCKQFELILGIRVIIRKVDAMLSVVYKGNRDINTTTYAYLMMTNQHYDAVSSIHGLLGKRKYCHSCDKAYDKDDEHKCESIRCSTCRSCRRPNCDSLNGERKWSACEECFRKFPTKDCYEHHKKVNRAGNSSCKTIWKCCKCNKIRLWVNENPETHVCGHEWCTNCGKYENPKTHD